MKYYQGLPGSNGAGGAHILPPDVYMGLEFGQREDGQSERVFLNVYDINNPAHVGEIANSLPNRAPITQQAAAVDMQGRPIRPQTVMQSTFTTKESPGRHEYPLMQDNSSLFGEPQSAGGQFGAANYAHQNQRCADNTTTELLSGLHT